MPKMGEYIIARLVQIEHLIIQLSMAWMRSLGVRVCNLQARVYNIGSLGVHKCRCLAAKPTEGYHKVVRRFLSFGHLKRVFEQIYSTSLFSVA